MNNNKEDTENNKCDKNAEKPRVIGRPFEPGNCANPNGRPKKGTAIADAMRDYLSGEIDTEGGKITRQQALVKAIYGKAMKGGDAAMRLLLNYVDGMPVQTNVNLSEDEDKEALIERGKAIIDRIKG